MDVAPLSDVVPARRVPSDAFVRGPQATVPLTLAMTLGADGSGLDEPANRMSSDPLSTIAAAATPHFLAFASCVRAASALSRAALWTPCQLVSFVVLVDVPEALLA